MITWGIDQWMNFFGIAGVSMYLLSYALVVYKIVEPHNRLNRFMRLVGFIFLLMPLGLRWYLSEKMIVMLAGLLALMGCVAILEIKYRR